MVYSTSEMLQEADWGCRVWSSPMALTHSGAVSLGVLLLGVLFLAMGLLVCAGFLILCGVMVCDCVLDIGDCKCDTFWLNWLRVAAAASTPISRARSRRSSDGNVPLNGVNTTFSSRSRSGMRSFFLSRRLRGDIAIVMVGQRVSSFLSINATTEVESCLS